jgi:hypothetical protein
MATALTAKAFIYPPLLTATPISTQLSCLVIALQTCKYV